MPQMLQVNVADNPATDEKWFSLDDLTLEQLEELQAQTDTSWTLWDDVWRHSVKLARAFYIAALKGSGAVEIGAEEAASQRVRLSLVRKGRIFRVVDDETDIPEKWDGATPLPPEGSCEVTTS